MAYVEINPDDARQLGVAPGEVIEVLIDRHPGATLDQIESAREKACRAALLMVTDACCPDSLGVAPFVRPEASLRWQASQSSKAALPRTGSPVRASAAFNSPVVSTATVVWACIAAGNSASAMNIVSLRFKSLPLRALPPTVVAWQALVGVVCRAPCTKAGMHLRARPRGIEHVGSGYEAEARIVLVQPLP